MITIKTESFEATVTPFRELPISEQYPALVEFTTNPASLFLTLIPVFRNQLSPDKLNEFDNLTAEQIGEVIEQFTVAANEVCEHGHQSSKECSAYNAGAGYERDFLLAQAHFIRGKKGRVIRQFLRGEN